MSNSRPSLFQCDSCFNCKLLAKYGVLDEASHLGMHCLRTFVCTILIFGGALYNVGFLLVYQLVIIDSCVSFAIAYYM